MRLTAIQEKEKTLAEVFDEFIKFKKANRMSPRTLLDYNKVIPKFIEFSHNSIDFDTLCDDVVDYFSQIPDTSPARYNQPYSNLSCLFNYMVRMHYLINNPITYMGLKKKRDEGNIKAASMEDIKKLLDTYNLKEFSDYRMYAMILLMLDTGIRTSEIVALKDADYSPEEKSITINKAIAKTRRSRTVFLSDETAKMINRIQEIKPKEWGDILFPSRDGKQLASHQLTVNFARHCEKAGIKITPYQLRHSFATYFFRNGGNVFTLQQLMGHSDIRMTKRYTDIDSDVLRQAHENNTPLNQLFSCSTRVRKI